MNDSPRVTGNTVGADFTIDGPFTSVLCGITTVPDLIDCKCMYVTFVFPHNSNACKHMVLYYTPLQVLVAVWSSLTWNVIEVLHSHYRLLEPFLMIVL